MSYLKILARPESRKLLLASFVRSRTALELSELTGIPIARCYCLLWSLRSAGFVTVEGALVSSRGRAKLLFRSRLRGLELFLRGNRLAGRIVQPRISEPSEGR